MRTLPIIGAGLMMLTACAGGQKENNYYVKANLGPDCEGKTVYLYDIDTDMNIDSAVVSDSVAIFNAPMTTGYQGTASVMLMLDGQGVARFYLEADSILINEGMAKGGELNNRLSAYWEERIGMGKEFRALPDSLQKERAEYYQAKSDSLDKAFFEVNKENAIGVEEILRNERPDNLAQIDSLTAKYPYLAGNAKLEKMRKAFNLEEETSVGKMFKDFEVTYNDSTFRLSDVVGKGKYVLVDFWASWCGPCQRQIPVIKGLYDKYNKEGLEVVSIAVWDEPESTLRALKSHDMPWTNVINAQQIPSDVYGFQGIPCIILFGPDGTIISRDKQGDELCADVDAAMKK